MQRFESELLELQNRLHEGERVKKELTHEVEKTKSDNVAKKEQIMSLSMELLAAKKAAEEKVVLLAASSSKCCIDWIFSFFVVLYLSLSEF